jgi:membrane protease YdiL (CAAX protease family)
MLIGAAAVAGAFWGLLYMKLRRLDTLIICHSLWSACIFAVVPLM